MLFSSSFPARNLKEITGRIFVRGECRHQLAMVMVKNSKRYEDKSDFLYFPKHFTECLHNHDIKYCGCFSKIEVSKALTNF